MNREHLSLMVLEWLPGLPAVVTAYNAADMESIPSNEVSFTLPLASPPGQRTAITVLLEKR